jgi:hypothetical protein
MEGHGIAGCGIDELLQGGPFDPARAVQDAEDEPVNSYASRFLDFPEHGVDSFQIHAEAAGPCPHHGEHRDLDSFQDFLDRFECRSQTARGQVPAYLDAISPGSCHLFRL